MLRFPILCENKIFAPGKGIQDAQVNCFYNIMGYNFNYHRNVYVANKRML